VACRSPPAAVADVARKIDYADDHRRASPLDTTVRLRSYPVAMVLAEMLLVTSVATIIQDAASAAGSLFHQGGSSCWPDPPCPPGPRPQTTPSIYYTSGTSGFLSGNGAPSGRYAVWVGRLTPDAEDTRMRAVPVTMSIRRMSLGAGYRYLMSSVARADGPGHAASALTRVLRRVRDPAGSVPRSGTRWS